MGGVSKVAILGRWTQRIRLEALEAWRAFLRKWGVAVWVEEPFAQAWEPAPKGTQEVLMLRTQALMAGGQTPGFVTQRSRASYSVLPPIQAPRQPIPQRLKVTIAR